VTIPKECKRLAEVDFPIAVVSKHSAREKSIRHGHPSTLHLWWARRPLAACRAMLLGLLLPDPCDKHCPVDFKEKARNLLPLVQGDVGSKDEDLRKALLKFIGDFANWDLSSNQTYLEVSRGLVKAAHPEETPLVVDPFAGGGSIPLEALRLGCEAFASDLNPVACLILKVMLEDIPRHGPELANELKRVGAEIKAVAEKELAEFYPPDPDGSRPIAYLWARTVRCESPNCGAEIPLMRSFWLSKKIGRKRALRYKVIRPTGNAPYVEFEIFAPKNDKEVPEGTVTRAKATCLCCNAILPPERVRGQLGEQRGGADVFFDDKGNRISGARILSVVVLQPGVQGRNYRLPIKLDYQAVRKAQGHLKSILDKWKNSGKKDLCPLPDEPLPFRHGHRSIQSPRVYGMNKWSDYYNARQNLSLECLCKIVSNIIEIHETKTVAQISALLLSKFAELATANCRWEPVAECPRSIFTRHDLPAMWDFAEGVPISSSSGSFDQTLQNIIGTLNRIGSNWRVGQVQQADARTTPLPDDSAYIWFTDPPYYDAVAYADLSDFFFIWLKRVLRYHSLLKDPFDADNLLTPKRQELTVTTVAGEDDKPKSNVDFEHAVGDSFAQGVSILNDSGIGCVVFAHKTTEGWEALLTGMITAGWVIVASWPIATEMVHRFNARDVAALATSVHLVCRPRRKNAPVGDWGVVLRGLPGRVGDWMERLQSEGIRGADLVFACIGPALEIFSRYSKVETAEGREVKLAEYLEKVWEVVGRTALEQVLGTEAAKARNGAAGAVEEDARLTALFLWTLQSTDGNGNNLTGKSPHPPFAKGGYSGEDSAKIRNVKDLAKGQAEDGSRKSPTLEKGGKGGFSEDIESGEEDDEDASTKGKQKGFTLVFDVVRRFAQPLGIHLPEWEGRIIETKKGVVRLFSIAERAKQLFGEEGAQAVADRLERSPEESLQLALFSETQEGAVLQIKGRGRQRKSGVSVSEESLKEHRGATTLDRVHAAMLLQASGRANALRALLKADVERSPDFLRLSNALSALYPKGSEEKRLVDAMLLAVPR
jgi:putative DNA methylase